MTFITGPLWSGKRDFACRLLGCKAVIPMHWGTFPVLAQNTDAFVKELVARAPQCRCARIKPGESVSL